MFALVCLVAGAILLDWIISIRSWNTPDYLIHSKTYLSVGFQSFSPIYQPYWHLKAHLCSSSCILLVAPAVPHEKAWHFQLWARCLFSSDWTPTLGETVLGRRLKRNWHEGGAVGPEDGWVPVGGWGDRSGWVGDTCGPRSCLPSAYSCPTSGDSFKKKCASNERTQGMLLKTVFASFRFTLHMHASTISSLLAQEDLPKINSQSFRRSMSMVQFAKNKKYTLEIEIWKRLVIAFRKYMTSHGSVHGCSLRVQRHLWKSEKIG